MNFEKPKISALIVPDVVADVTTLQLWCHGSTFGVPILNFACSYNLATLHLGCLYNVVTLNVNVVTLL